MIKPKKKKDSGKWAIRWREAGHAHQLTFDTKKIADKAAVEINHRLQTRGLVELDKGRITLAEFVVIYWQDYAIPNLKPNTRETYLRVWGKHLHPRIGDTPLRDLTAERLTALRGDLQRAGVNDPTVLKAFTMLQGVLRQAVIYGHIDKNAARDVRKPSQARQKDLIIPTPDQVEQLRNLFLERKDRRSATIVSLLAYAGLRTFSEIHNLELGHIGGKGLRVYSTKTSRGDVVTLLGPLKTDLAEYRMSRGGTLTDKSPVIPRPDGEALRNTDWRNWRRRVYRPAAKLVGLDGSTPYSLRHAFASLLIWEGRSIAEVAKQMRNSVATSASVYVHVLEEFDHEKRCDAAERIRQARATARERNVG